MKAIVKQRPKEDHAWAEGLSMRELPEPMVEHPEDVKVRVVAAGICGTDVGIFKSRQSLRESMARAARDPIVVGHEFVGTIEDLGAHARLRLARILGHLSRHDERLREFVSRRSAEQIASDPNLTECLKEHFFCSAEMHITCGWCHQCRIGEQHVCQNTVIKGVHDHGAFADFLVVPASNLILFRRDELPLEVIAFMDAIGNAVHTVQSIDVPGKAVAILGSGVQGLMATAVARQSGASRIYLTGLFARGHSGASTAERVFGLARRFGADQCFDLGQTGAREALLQAVMDDTDGTGVDAVLEMSGSYSAYRDALDVVRMGGTLALLGLPEGEWALDFAREVVFRGITIRGVVGRRVFSTWEAMRNLLSGGLAREIIDSGFVSHTLPLEDYASGIAAILEGQATKVILRV